MPIRQLVLGAKKAVEYESSVQEEMKSGGINLGVISHIDDMLSAMV